MTVSLSLTEDIFESDANVLVNPVNCVGVMGAGLALEFKRRFPEMYASYVRDCRLNLVQLGIPYLYRDTVRGITIVNFPTKHHWKDKSKLQDINRGLMGLRDMNIPYLAMPAVGCGLGGLSVEDVLQSVDFYFGKSSKTHVEFYLPRRRRE